MTQRVTKCWEECQSWTDEERAELADNSSRAWAPMSISTLPGTLKLQSAFKNWRTVHCNAFRQK